jgi:hypothetical protein
MSGSTGPAGVKNAIAHQVHIGHLFCPEHSVALRSRIGIGNKAFLSKTALDCLAKNLMVG